jgi:hypothetical protein
MRNSRLERARAKGARIVLAGKLWDYFGIADSVRLSWRCCPIVGGIKRPSKLKRGILCRCYAWRAWRLGKLYETLMNCMNVIYNYNFARIARRIASRISGKFFMRNVILRFLFVRERSTRSCRRDVILFTQACVQSRLFPSNNIALEVAYLDLYKSRFRRSSTVRERLSSNDIAYTI